jgi:hypothetical protein
MLLNKPPDHEAERRRALAKVYALLIRLAEEKQTAHPDNFGEETGKADDTTTPTGVKANDKKLYTHTPGGQKGA